MIALGKRVCNTPQQDGSQGEEMKSEWLAILIQLGAMNGQDFFMYTDPYANLLFVSKGVTYQFQEEHDLPNFFVENRITPIYVTLYTGVQTGVVLLLDDFDKEHLAGFPIGTKDLFLAFYVWKEMEAIDSYARFGAGPPNRSWEFLRLSFN